MLHILILFVLLITIAGCDEKKPKDPLAGFKIPDHEINKMSAGKMATIIARYRRLEEKDKPKVKRYVDKLRKRLARMPESQRRMTHEVNRK